MNLWLMLGVVARVVVVSFAGVGNIYIDRRRLLARVYVLMELLDV